MPHRRAFPAAAVPRNAKDGRRQWRRALAPAACMAAAASSWAAGGHHAVEDAQIMESGRCHLETWFETASGRNLQHLGPACRLGPVEVGLNIERAAERGQGAAHSVGPQIKWGVAVAEGWSVGLRWGTAWQDGAPRWGGHALIATTTWLPASGWKLNANLGRDFRRDQRDATLRGVSAEWQPVSAAQLMAEWFDDGDRPRRRLALRWFLGEDVSLDLGRAEAVSAPRRPWWTVGVNWEFDR